MNQSDSHLTQASILIFLSLSLVSVTVHSTMFSLIHASLSHPPVAISLVFRLCFLTYCSRYYSEFLGFISYVTYFSCICIVRPSLSLVLSQNILFYTLTHSFSLANYCCHVLCVITTTTPRSTFHVTPSRRPISFSLV